MNVRFLGLVLMAGALSLAAGCYSTQDGRVKAGVPFSKDTITSRYEVPYARLHDAAIAVIKRKGVLTNDDAITKVLRGVVDQRNVWISLDDTEPKITKMTIQVRTSGGTADIDLASELDKQIYGELLSTQR